MVPGMGRPSRPISAWALCSAPRSWALTSRHLPVVTLPLSSTRWSRTGCPSCPSSSRMPSATFRCLRSRRRFSSLRLKRSSLLLSGDVKVAVPSPPFFRSMTLTALPRSKWSGSIQARRCSSNSTGCLLQDCRLCFLQKHHFIPQLGQRLVEGRHGDTQFRLFQRYHPSGRRLAPELVGHDVLGCQQLVIHIAERLHQRRALRVGVQRSEVVELLEERIAMGGGYDQQAGIDKPDDGPGHEALRPGVQVGLGFLDHNGAVARLVLEEVHDGRQLGNQRRGEVHGQTPTASAFGQIVIAGQWPAGGLLHLALEQLMLEPLSQRRILSPLLLAWLGERLQKAYHRQRKLAGAGLFVIAKARVKQAEGIANQGAVGQHEARARGGQKQRFAIAAACRTTWPKQGTLMSPATSFQVIIHTARY